MELPEEYFYPTPESRRQNRKELYPWTKEEKKAKTLLMEREMSRVCLRPIRSAKPPHTNAPTIIPRYTIRPENQRSQRKREEKKKELKPT